MRFDWLLFRHLPALFYLRFRTFINLLVVSDFLLLVVVVLWVLLAIISSSTHFLWNRSQNAALLGYKTVFDDLADVFSFWILSILAQLRIFELTDCLLVNFHSGSLSRQNRVGDGPAQVQSALRRIRPELAAGAVNGRLQHSVLLHQSVLVRRCVVLSS